MTRWARIDRLFQVLSVMLYRFGHFLFEDLGSLSYSKLITLYGHKVTDKIV